MPTGTRSLVVAIGGTTLNEQPTIETGENVDNYITPLPAGNAGTLSTRTGDGVGVVTLESGHGIAATDIFDLYWVGGARYAITCDSADATTVTFDDTPAATGDVLPAEAFAIIATERKQINTTIDGDVLQQFATHCDQRAQVTFYDVGDAIIKQYAFPVANVTEDWYQSSAEANPLTGNPITYAMASNGSITAATLSILTLGDSSP